LGGSEPNEPQREPPRAPDGGGARCWTRHFEVVAVLLVIFGVPVVDILLQLGDPRAHGVDANDAPPWWLLARLPFEAGMAVILLQLLRHGRGVEVPPAPTSSPGWKRELLLGLALGFGLFFALFASSIVVRRLGIPGDVSPWDAVLRTNGGRVLFSFETPFAATYEEIAFRAYLQTRLTEWMPRSRLLAVVLAAGAFSLTHGYSPAGSLCVYLFGMLQGFAYLRWRRLPRLVVAHAFTNVLMTWL